MTSARVKRKMRERRERRLGGEGGDSGDSDGVSVEVVANLRCRGAVRRADDLNCEGKNEAPVDIVRK